MKKNKKKTFLRDKNINEVFYRDEKVIQTMPKYYKKSN